MTNFARQAPPFSAGKDSGHVSVDNRMTQAKFVSVACGFENNVDMVGALNVLEWGHRLLACREPAQSGRSVKQEPTEATAQVSAIA
jgi:putative transposase